MPNEKKKGALFKVVPSSAREIINKISSPFFSSLITCIVDRDDYHDKEYILCRVRKTKTFGPRRKVGVSTLKSFSCEAPKG